jgi:hypothetical protein
MRHLHLLRHFRDPALGLLGALGACSHAAPTPSLEPAAAAPSAASAAAPADPYHPPPRDTVDVAAYKAWQQYSLQCARCHGETARAPPSRRVSSWRSRPDGHPSRRSSGILINGRHDKECRRRPRWNRLGLLAAVPLPQGPETAASWRPPARRPQVVHHAPQATRVVSQTGSVRQASRRSEIILDIHAPRPAGSSGASMQAPFPAPAERGRRAGAAG